MATIDQTPPIAPLDWAAIEAMLEPGPPLALTPLTDALAGELRLAVDDLGSAKAQIVGAGSPATDAGDEALRGMLDEAQRAADIVALGPDDAIRAGLDEGDVKVTELEGLTSQEIGIGGIDFSDDDDTKKPPDGGGDDGGLKPAD